MTDRVPGEDAPLYRGGAYAPPNARLDGLVEPLRRLSEHFQLRALGSLSPGSRIFEVGAGDGRLLRRLERAGHVVEGSDPFAVPGSGLAATPAEELELERQSYDLVILWHVLEHLENPHAVLARLAPALKPTGRLVVAVPNLGSVQARVGGDRWFHQDVPRHAVHFTPRGLTALVERAGLRASRSRTVSPDQNFLGMAQTMLTLVGRRRDLGFGTLKQRRPAARDIGLVALAAGVIAPVAVAAEWAAGVVGRGGSIVLHASPRT